MISASLVNADQPQNEEQNRLERPSTFTQHEPLFVLANPREYDPELSPDQLKLLGGIVSAGFNASDYLFDVLEPRLYKEGDDFYLPYGSSFFGS